MAMALNNKIDFNLKKKKLAKIEQRTNALSSTILHHAKNSYQKSTNVKEVSS